MLTSMHPQAEKFFNKTYPEQRSDAWFKMRGTMLTASDAGTAIGVNPYEKPEKLILKKCGVSEPFNDWATKHGQKYEDEARQIYEERHNQKVFEIGLEPHHTLDWIGGSPDGITYSGRLLEIKCPKSRAIGDGTPPEYYYAQVQVLMECLELEVCDFVQYRPAEITYPKPAEFVCVEIPRNREWWATNMPIMKAFWDRVLWHREHGHQELLPAPKPTIDDLIKEIEGLEGQLTKVKKMALEIAKEHSTLKTGRWSNEDEEWLLKNKDKKMEELAEHLKRTVKATKMRLEKLIKEQPKQEWTVKVVEEDDI